MTPWVILGLGLAGGLLAFAVHVLERGARRELEVATLRPFADQSRPRLQLARLRQPLLLLVRLLLLLALASGLANLYAHNEAQPFGRNVTLVVPGTPDASWAPLVATADVRWLDGRLTPVTRRPADNRPALAEALLDADRQIPPDRSLAVVGAWPAREWPAVRLPLRRALDYRPAPGPDRGPAARWPSRLVVVTDQPAARAWVDSAVAVWRRFGLAENTEIDWQGPESTLRAGVDGVIWWTESPVPAGIPFATVVAASDDGAGRLEAPRDGEDPAQFAERLWRALSRFEVERPPAGVTLATLPVSRSDWSARATPETPAAPLWLTLCAGLFALERVLAGWSLRS